MSLAVDTEQEREFLPRKSVHLVLPAVKPTPVAIADRKKTRIKKARRTSASWIGALERIFNHPIPCIEISAPFLKIQPEG